MAYNRFSNFNRFCTRCVQCNGVTSKTHAREHNGLCKICVVTNAGGTPDLSRHPLLCPTCKERLRTAYQKKHGYHCDACTKATDPVGWANEVRGFYDGPDC